MLTETLPAPGTDFHAYVAVAWYFINRDQHKLLADHLLRSQPMLNELLGSSRPNFNDIADSGFRCYIEGV